MSFEIDDRDFLRQMDLNDDRVRAACLNAVDELGEMVKAEAQDLCPVSPQDPKHPQFIKRKDKDKRHSGFLQASINKTDAEIKGGDILVEIGANADYAAAVHERTWVNHKYPGAKNPKAQAKFLSQALLRQRYNAARHIAAAVRAVLA